MTDFAGCCACCKTEPHGVPKDEKSRQEASCRAASCPACGGTIECPKVSANVAELVAKCKDGTCAVVRP